MIHVASWAAKFLFTGEQLNQPVGRLSGGERARVLIAQLMLQPADVLLLDEPTNDLDIPTLDILEESLLEFRGSLVLVTHDRYMLDRVSTMVLGLDGQAKRGLFADYSQWESWLEERKQTARNDLRDTHVPRQRAVPAEKRGSRPGKRNCRIWKRGNTRRLSSASPTAEVVLQAKRDQLEDPEIVSDGPRLMAAHAEMEEAQDKVDTALCSLGRAGEKEELSSNHDLITRSTQEARQKAMIVFPRVPVLSSSFSSSADSRSSGSGFISQRRSRRPKRPGSRVRRPPTRLRIEPAAQRRDKSWDVIHRVRNSQFQDRAPDKARRWQSPQNVQQRRLLRPKYRSRIAGKISR